jgi:hypothetical protein
MGGDKTPPDCWQEAQCAGTAGVYGTEFQFAPLNFPGYRTPAATWTDTKGRFWLFGGTGRDSAGASGELNDLWVFDPAMGAHGEWAWMGGSSTKNPHGVYGTEYQFSDTNVPGGRDSTGHWIDKDGRLWIFGGAGIGNLNWGMNDLWAFDPTLGVHGQWAWMGGTNYTGCPPKSCSPLLGNYGTEYEFADANLPGMRSKVDSWTDGGGRFWLLGGFGKLGDGTWSSFFELWVFDPAKGAHGEWAWTGGGVGEDYGCNVCGTLYQFAPDNFPSLSDRATLLTGEDDKLWSYGGYGPGLRDFYGESNDLWVFDPGQGAHGEWTCMGGVSAQPVQYGTEYAFSPDNFPATDGGGTGWVDKSGRLWIFGGFKVNYGAIGLGTQHLTNELWAFDPTMGAHGEWAWMGGDGERSWIDDGTGHPPAPVPPGSYGTKYQFDSTHRPPPRYGANAWTDLNGNFWLYGSSTGDLNDLWELKFLPSQTISFTPLPSEVTYGVAPMTLSARASSGFPITFSILSGPAKTSGSNGSNLTITGAGTVVVAAYQDGNGEYGATQATQTILVDKASQTILFPALPQPLTYGAAPITLSATSSSGLPVTYKLVAGPGQLSGNTLTITGGGAAVVVNAYQTGNSVYGRAPLAMQGGWVFRAPLTVTADNKTMLYGGTVPALTSTPTGFVNGDTASVLTGAPTLSTIVTSTTLPGTYAIRIIKNTLTAANYLVAPKWGTLIVQPLGTVATPTFSPAGGTYTGAKSVRILDPTATIYYTVDGSTPSQTHGTHYTGPVTVSTSQTLKAIAVKKGYTPSAAASATYTID